MQGLGLPTLWSVCPCAACAQRARSWDAGLRIIPAAVPETRRSVFLLCLSVGVLVLPLLCFLRSRCCCYCRGPLAPWQTEACALVALHSSSSSSKERPSALSLHVRVSLSGGLKCGGTHLHFPSRPVQRKMTAYINTFLSRLYPST